MFLKSFKNGSIAQLDRVVVELKYMKSIEDFEQTEDGKYICPECNKTFKKGGICGHFWRCHTEEGQNLKTGQFFHKERNGKIVAWNKGLTKETDERVKKQGETFHNRYVNGVINRSSSKHSEETKKKISEARKKFLLEHPDKVPYKLNHSSKQSYPEKFFENFLNENSIKFSKEYYACGYWLDFCFNEKYYIEVDGEQHYVDQRIVKHDIERTKKLSENGFILIQRIRWSSFQKLSRDEKDKYLKDLSLRIKELGR